MKQTFDREIREQLAREPVQVPPAVHNQLEQLLESLPEKQKVRPIRRISRVWQRSLTAAACLLLVFLVVLPNVSGAYAGAMERVPVLGTLVRVMTVRNYIRQEGERTLEARIPQVEDSVHPDASARINMDVEELTDTVIDRFYEELELFGDGSRGSMYVNYEVLTNTDRWFTLKISVLEISGSGNEQVFCYNIDRTTGQYVSFGDLFDAGERTALEQLVEGQLQPPCWTEDEAGQEHFWALREDQNFYFTADGTLQLVYQEYELGPGYLGCPEISIAPADYEPYL